MPPELPQETVPANLESLDGSQPLPARAYADLREQIILGHYRQGSRLPEQRLAKDLHVSRIPLREAISQLEVDGFVRSTHRRGAVVSTWTVEDVDHLFDVRLSLEVGAAGLAAQAADLGSDLSTLWDALATADQQVEAGDAFRIAEASAAFHEVVVQTTGNSLMASLMRAVSGRMVWLFYLTSQRDAATACSEHHELTSAIESGNRRVAECVAYAHIERGRVPSRAAIRGDG